eukprot:TRINITY_DN2787_c3_g1_i2.p1 TRINITY_DN2787_c3_g1~~TRINITY_DN2787_c3_g1_i2.p1  ORF type:complete len:1767 (+),score=460.25 TRINITY_DN2787_c3_g1_i2:57-5357(+)
MRQDVDRSSPDGGWLRTLYPDAASDISRASAGLLPMRTRSPQRRIRMTDSYQEERAAVERLRSDFMHGRLLEDDDMQAALRKEDAVAKPQAPPGSPSPRRGRSPVRGVSDCALYADAGNKAVRDQAASSAHTKELLHRAKQVSDKVDIDMQARRLLVEQAKEASAVSSLPSPSQDDYPRKRVKIERFQSALPWLQKVLSDDDPPTPGDSRRHSRAGKDDLESGAGSEDGGPEQSAAALRALAGSSPMGPTPEPQLDEAAVRLRVEKAAMEAADAARQEARETAVNAARETVSAEIDGLQRQIAGLEAELSLKTSIIHDQKLVQSQLNSKISALREELFPLQAKERMMNLVDVEEMQQEIEFYEQERNYLYTKIFRLDLTWMRPDAKSVANEKGGDKNERFDRVFGGQMQALAGKTQGDKLVRRLADKARMLTIQLLKGREQLRLSEIREMTRHDQDCFTQELRAQAQRRGDSGGVPRRLDRPSGLMDTEIRGYLSNNERRMAEVLAREETMRTRPSRGQGSTWDEVSDERLADRTLALAGWDESTQPEVRILIRGMLVQSFYSMARTDINRIRVLHATLQYVPGFRKEKNDALTQLAEVEEKVRTERLDSSTAMADSVKAILGALSESRSGDAAFIAAELGAAFAQQPLAQWTHPAQVRRHSLHCLSGDKLQEAIDARKELVQCLEEGVAMSSARGIAAMVQWSNCVAADAAIETYLKEGNGVEAGSAIVDHRGQVIGYAGEAVHANEMTLVSDHDGQVHGRVGHGGGLLDLEGNTIWRTHAKQLFPQGVFSTMTGRKVGEVAGEKTAGFVAGPDGTILDVDAVRKASTGPETESERADRLEEARKQEEEAEQQAKELDEMIQKMEAAVAARKSQFADSDADEEQDGDELESSQRTTGGAGPEGGGGGGGGGRRKSGKRGGAQARVAEQKRQVGKLKHMLAMVKEETSLKMGRLEQRLLALHHLLFRFVSKLKGELDIPEEYVRVDMKKVREEVEKHMRGVDDPRMERVFALFGQDMALVSNYLTIITRGASTGREQQAMGALRAGIYRVQRGQDEPRPPPPVAQASTGAAPLGTAADLLRKAKQQQQQQQPGDTKTEGGSTPVQSPTPAESRRGSNAPMSASVRSTRTAQVPEPPVPGARTPAAGATATPPQSRPESPCVLESVAPQSTTHMFTPGDDVSVPQPAASPLEYSTVSNTAMSPAPAPIDLQPRLSTSAVYSVVGQHAVALHNAILTFCELVKKRLRLRHAKGDDALADALSSAESAGDCPDVPKLLESDKAVVDAFVSLLEDDDAAAVEESKAVFQRIGTRVRLDRLRHLKAEEDGDDRGAKVEKKLQQFLDRQEQKMLAGVRKLEERKERLRQERVSRWAAFFQPAPSVPTVSSAEAGITVEVPALADAQPTGPVLQQQQQQQQPSSHLLVPGPSRTRAVMASAIRSVSFMSFLGSRARGAGVQSPSSLLIEGAGGLRDSGGITRAREGMLVRNLSGGLARAAELLHSNLSGGRAAEIQHGSPTASSIVPPESPTTAPVQPTPQVSQPASVEPAVAATAQRRRRSSAQRAAMSAFSSAVYTESAADVGTGPQATPIVKGQRASLPGVLSPVSSQNQSSVAVEDFRSAIRMGGRGGLGGSADFARAGPRGHDRRQRTRQPALPSPSTQLQFDLGAGAQPVADRSPGTLRRGSAGRSVLPTLNAAQRGTAASGAESRLQMPGNRARARTVGVKQTFQAAMTLPAKSTDMAGVSAPPTASSAGRFPGLAALAGLTPRKM